MYNKIVEHVNKLRKESKNTTKFKKPILFRFYLSPLGRAGIYRYQKRCVHLKQCTDWYTQAIMRYAKNMKIKRVVPQIGALVGGDQFITGTGPGFEDELTKFIIGVSIRDRLLHMPADIISREKKVTTIVLQNKETKAYSIENTQKPRGKIAQEFRKGVNRNTNLRGAVFINYKHGPWIWSQAEPNYEKEPMMQGVNKLSFMLGDFAQSKGLFKKENIEGNDIVG